MEDPYDEPVSTSKPDSLMPDLVGQTEAASTTAVESGSGSGNDLIENANLVSGFGDGIDNSTDQILTDNKPNLDLLSPEADEFAFGDTPQDQPFATGDKHESLDLAQRLAEEPASGGVDSAGLLLDFGQTEPAANSPAYSFNPAHPIQGSEEEDIEEEMDDATPVVEARPDSDFVKYEATPPPSPPPSPEPVVDPPAETPPFTPFPLSSPADSTSPASPPPTSEDRPMRMPKVTTISPASGKGGSTRITSGTPSGAWYRNVSPQVCDLLLWRQPITTGCVLAALLFTLLSLTCCSVFSVISYTLLLAVVVSLGARVVKFFMAKVHHGDETHPFNVAFEMELSVDESDAEEYARNVAEMLNKTTNTARDLILVKDFVPSIKFGVVLYAATYIGAWFNGLTVLILAVVGAFTLPKVYEVNKVQVDNYVEIGMTKFHDAYDQLQAKVPFLKQKSQ